MSEQHFFPDPVCDRLMRANFLLAAELHVTRDRVRALEAVLAAKGLVSEAEIEGVVFSADDQARADAERDRLIEALMDLAAHSDD